MRGTGHAVGTARVEEEGPGVEGDELDLVIIYCCSTERYVFSSLW